MWINHITTKYDFPYEEREFFIILNSCSPKNKKLFPNKYFMSFLY